MSNPGISRVYELFNAVIELPEEQQRQYLERECAGDLELLKELHGLLESDQRVGALTARPVAADLARLLTEATVKDTFGQSRIGPFEIRERVGHGGMGVVYRAERVDGTVEQQVAIKFVRRELLTDEVRSRFMLERRALATMDHPNIARLIDAAELKDGTPYYVMEYVQGAPLTEYVKQHALSIPDRVRLFRTICEAVAHAHRSLIVHRDLKPSNILVTSDGTPKLLDFGIAKTLTAEEASSEQTGTQHRYFSPRYAAPEQILGEPIGVGCDVYALGLLLCECLADAPAFDFTGLSPTQIERQITAVPPSPPSQIAAKRGAPANTQRQLRGDLDGVVLKCLRKFSQERYSSVELLIVDLDNYLSGRPVSARGGQVWYRARKFVRRNLIPVSAATLSILSLLSGVIAFATQAHIARLRADELTQVAAFQSELLSNLDPASGGASISGKVLKSLTEALSEQGISDEHRKARLDAFTTNWNELNHTELARQFVDDILLEPAVASARADFSDQPALSAKLLEGLGVAYSRIGANDSALPVLQEALALNQRATGENSLATVTTKSWLGEVYFQMKDYDNAQELNRAALAGFRKVLGDDHDHTISAMVSLSASLSDAGEYNESLALAHEAMRRADEVLGPDHLETLRAVARMGNYHLVQGEYSQADPYLHRVLAARERTLGEDHRETLTVLGNLIYSLLQQGKYQEARPYSMVRLERSERSYGIEHPGTANAHLNHGVLLRRLGLHEDAETSLREALRIRSIVSGANHPETIWVRNSLGLTLQEMPDRAAAELFARETLALSREHLGESHRETLVATHILGSQLLKQEQIAEALELLSPVEQATRKAFGARAPTANYLFSLGKARSGSNEFQGAERALLDAQSIFESLSQYPEIEAECRLAIDQLYASWQQHDPSAELKQRIAEWRRRAKK